jgi:hypothetical protein
MMRLKDFVTAGFLAVLALGPALAGTLSGTVKDSGGKPMAGVMVRLSNGQTGVAESIFTDSLGAYVFKTALEGELDYRLRLPYYRDVATEIKLGKNATLTRSDVMQAMTTPEEISESLPAAYHFGSLPFETGEGAKLSRVQFQRDCLTCHQLGNAFTRYPRSVQNWSDTIKRMHSFMGNFDAELRDRRAALLAKGFDGKPIAVRPTFPLDPALAIAKIYEYQMPPSRVPHDAEVNPNDGKVYTVDQFAELMAVTDLKTGVTKYYKQPDEGNPLGGRFTELGLQIPLGTSLRHGPHSLANFM